MGQGKQKIVVQRTSCNFPAYSKRIREAMRGVNSQQMWDRRFSELIREGVTVDGKVQGENMMNVLGGNTNISGFRQSMIAFMLGLFFDGREKSNEECGPSRWETWGSQEPPIYCNIHRRDDDPIAIYFGKGVKGKKIALDRCDYATRVNPGQGYVLHETGIRLGVEWLGYCGQIALKATKGPGGSDKVLAYPLFIPFTFSELEYWDGFFPFSTQLLMAIYFLEANGNKPFVHAEADGYNHFAIPMDHVRSYCPSLAEGVPSLEDGQREEDLGIYIDHYEIDSYLETVYDRMARDILGILEVERRKAVANA